MVSGLVGLKFVRGGRNPRYGLDCWGLVMEVYRRYGIVLPDTRAGVADKDEWEEVKRPSQDDVPLVVMMSIHPEFINHAGVWVGGGKILHTMATTNAVLSRKSILENRIRGYYRYVQNN